MLRAHCLPDCSHGIVTISNGSVIDCCMRDLSETGARIRCSDPAAVPHTFRLLMPHDNITRNITRDAEVV